ncbi:hypothetical protein [Streptomyces sp. NBRC 110611]|uniref:hypothetical protein n=1 Tax=Streptomyces sp. NBRC 110611 TaxID=1621259 RepID=UPI00082CCA81|nr:hypothetical protein [Streptomyces sp. NBRC 110611]
MPAATVTVRAHQGLLIMMRFQKLEGPFCRTCGTAVFRQMTAATLALGWWSPFSLVFFTPFTLIWNALARTKLNKLTEPAPGQPGQQLDPGTPVLRRAVSYVALLPLAWAIWVIAHIIGDITGG